MFKFIIVFFLLLSTQLFAHTKELTLQLIWKNQFQFAGFYVAKELGFYKDVGMDVKILENKDGVDPTKLIEDEKVDFAIGSSSLLIDKSNSKDIVALGAVYQQSPLILLARTDSGINSINDLKNKNVMIAHDKLNSAAIHYMLNSHNITFDDINLMSNDCNLDNLINGNIDAITAYSSNEPFILKEKNIDYKVFNPVDHGFDFYSDILFTSSKFIKNNPQLTKDFYSASKEGWDYAFNNITETAQIIYEKYNTQNKSLLQLINEGEALKELAYDEFNLMFQLDKEKLHKTVDIYKVLGFIENEVDLDTFIYAHNSDDIYNIKFEHNDIYHFMLTILFLFTFLIALIIYYSVHKKWLLTKHKLEEALRVKEKEINKKNLLIIQQAKMAALGDMLSNIAHQWRQPLNAISLNISMIDISLKLQEKIKEEDLLKCIDSTSNQISYLSDTIDVFRNFLVSDAKDIQNYAIKDIITATELLITDSFKHEHITVVNNINNFTLPLSKSHIMQVLINILNNAKDAMIENNSQGDSRYIFIDTYTVNKKAIITIKDSAGGIKKDIIGKIFDPYFSTKHNSQGTGIGLYIVHELISTNLKGTIEVKNSTYTYESKKLTGAEFIITLPLSFNANNKDG